MADECIDVCGENEIDICISTGPPGPRGGVGKITQFIFYPPVGTTDITGTDNSGTLMEVDPDGCLMSINGVMLEPEADYTISADGLTVTLNQPIQNANDVVTVQTWQSDEQSSNDVLDLKLEVEQNKDDIAALDVRVTQNEDDIETLQNAASSFTTRDVQVSGVNTARAVEEDLKTQQDVNLHLDQSIADVEDRIDSLETKQPENDQSLQDISDAIEENAQGISDLSTGLDDLTDVVSDNVEDITSLQDQVNNLPPPTDISELEEDVDEMASQIGKNTLAIADNKSRLDALEEPVSLDDLEEAVEDLDSRVTANESDIKDIKATDAAQQISINDLEADVVKLQNKTVDTSGLALLAEENQFLQPQSVKDGLKITGTNAFVQMDTGTTLEVSNGNFSDSVIDIKRSNGDTAMSFEASGHIRGIKTDENDPTSAVNVQFLEDIGVGGGEHNHDTYATKLELKDESRTRELADIDLQNQIDRFEAYDDSGINKSLADETAARIAGDAALNDKIDNLNLGDELPDGLVDEDRLTEVLEDYATETFVEAAIADFATENFVEDAVRGLATEEYVDEGDAATLEAAKHFTEGEMIGVATEDFVSSAIENAGEFITESYTQSIADQAEVQAEKDAEQDAEMNMIEGRLAAVESVTIDGVWELDLQMSLPRPGEFVLLKATDEIANTFDEVTILVFSDESKMGVIDFSAVTAGDVFRIATAQDEEALSGRLSESLAEFKVNGRLGTTTFTVDLIRSNGEPQDGTDYGARLLSSFDPEGLATLDGTVALIEKAEQNCNNYTDAQIAAADYLPTTGGTVTGKVIFKDGSFFDSQTNTCLNGRSSFNIRVAADRPMTLETGSSYKAVLRTLQYDNQDGANGDRSLSPFVLYANGNIDTKNINAKGQIKIENQEFKLINENGTNDVRFVPSNRATFSIPVQCNEQLDMKDNKIIGCGPADPDRGHDVVNVDFLNEALGNIETGTDTDALDERYVSKEGDSISSYLKVESASSGTSSVPFGVYTRSDFDKPRFHVTGTGSVRAGTTSNDAFMANYDYDMVTLKKLKEEIEKLRSDCTPLLWKYNPDVLANDLGNGEFNLGANPDWDGDASTYLYMAKLNIKGKKWYGKNGDSGYSHDLGWWGMVTITDYDPDIVMQAKAGKLHFNEGSNNYFKINISYLKKNFGLNKDRYYNINIPGFLPQFKYTNSMYTEGNTFSAFDAPEEKKVEE